MKSSKILLVEGNKELCEKWATLLSEGSGSLIASSDSTAAFKQLTEKSFDIVILDARMPQSFLSKALTLLHSLEQKPAIILTSTVSEVPEYRFLQKTPQALFLLKPIATEKLKSTVEAQLSQVKLRKAS